MLGVARGSRADLESPPGGRGAIVHRLARVIAERFFVFVVGGVAGFLAGATSVYVGMLMVC